MPEFEIPATVVIEADTLAEAAVLAGPVVDDVNSYLTDDCEIRLKHGPQTLTVGEG